MTTPWIRPLAWLGAMALACGLAACGGGSDGGVLPLQTPTPDARSGSYQMYAADARLYTLALDFDARTWRLAGNGEDSNGTFSASGTGFSFDPTGAAPAVNNARFTQGGDSVTGAFRFAGGLVPFIAARSFTTSVADAAGAYKLLALELDPTVPADTAIFTAEIVAPATWRQCSDPVIVTIATCPPASVTTGTVVQSGDQLTVTVPGGSFGIRVVRIGGDKVLLRAGPAAATPRRFWVGLDQAGGFADASFAGVNTSAQSTSTTVAGASFSATLRSEGGATATRSGTAGPASAALPGLLAIRTVGEGNFFAMRSADLDFVFAARQNPVLPGYVEIGRR